MFSALLASASAILAALLQTLKPPPKNARLFTYILVFICVVFLILAIFTEKPRNDGEETVQPVSRSIIEICILQEEEVKRFVDENMGLPEITGFEKGEVIMYRIKIESTVWK